MPWPGAWPCQAAGGGKGHRARGSGECPAQRPKRGGTRKGCVGLAPVAVGGRPRPPMHLGEPTRHEAAGRKRPQPRCRSSGAYSPGPESSRANAFASIEPPATPVRGAVR